MAAILSLMVVMGFMMVGEWVSTRSRAYVPSVFITALLFLIGFWTVVPKNIVPAASFGTAFIQITQAVLLVHMGTLMDLKLLLKQWRAVVIALSGVVGTIILTMGIGRLFFNWHTIVASVPPLTGGLVAAFLMTAGLKAQHITALVAFPVAMFVMHSMLGYPLTAWMLKRESRRLLKTRQAVATVVTDDAVTARATVNTVAQVPSGDVPTADARVQLSKFKIHAWHLPAAYDTSAFMLFKVAAVTVLAEGTAQLMHGVVNQYIVCLIFGVIAHQLGFLENAVLEKAGVFHWLMYGLLAYIFANLNIVKISMLSGILVPIVTLIVLGVLGMFIASSLLARPLGFSREMAFASALTALFGFPADYIVTHEVTEIMGTTPDEKQYLLDQMLPKMLVGGFATVSVASVIIASIFLKIL
ncbi:membrane protein [Lactiplantibacillus plantarum EGD-AQ4]|nr:membrane protein [Lactiplantibacillus plantarum EGD-AQ4]